MKSFAAAFLLALLPVFAAKAQDNVIDEVIWVVGDEAILKSEVEEYKETVPASGGTRQYRGHRD